MIARYLLAWLLMVPLGILNGTLRQFTYGRIVPELRAHQLSTLTGIMAFAAYVWLVDRQWPFASASDALLVGPIWVVLTVAFEFTFGRLVAKLPWQRLLQDYNLAAGRLWLLLLAALAFLPLLVFKLRTS